MELLLHLDTLPIHDQAQAIKLAANDISFAKKLLNMFVNELPYLQSSFLTAWTRQDLNDLLLKIHKFHGSCCYLGVPRLKKIAQVIEINLNNRTLTNMPELLSLLDNQISLLLQEYCAIDAAFT